MAFGKVRVQVSSIIERLKEILMGKEDKKKSEPTEEDMTTGPFKSYR